MSPGVDRGSGRDEWFVRSVRIDADGKVALAVAHWKVYHNGKLTNICDSFFGLRRIDGTWKIARSFGAGASLYVWGPNDRDLRDYAVEDAFEGPLVGVRVQSGQETKLPPVQLHRAPSAQAGLP
jgi:hypothetical protein